MYIFCLIVGYSGNLWAFTRASHEVFRDHVGQKDLGISFVASRPHFVPPMHGGTEKYK